MLSGLVVKDIVLAGAGHAHVAVLRRFGMRKMPGVRLTLVTREVDTPYSGMLPGLIAGHYDFDEVHIDTGPLARFAGARLYHDEVVGIDVAAQRVLCRSRPPVPYDLLSLDIGSRPTTFDVPGAAEHAIPVKPIDEFRRRFEALRTRVLEEGRPRHVAVVGGGAGGVELLLSVERRLRRDRAALGHDPALLSFTLIAASAEILPGFPSALARRFRTVFAARDIPVLAGARVVRVGPSQVQYRDSSGEHTLITDEVLWTTQAAPASWLAQTGLELDSTGFLRVDAQLRALGRSDVFAAGDTVAFEPAPIPRSGVYAVRAGPVLAANLRATLAGTRLMPYRPQQDALYIISTGERYAFATRNGRVVEGRWVWRVKDYIDRRFMHRFNKPPAMVEKNSAPVPRLADDAARAALSATAMRCGGCGAKVGATILSRALGQIVAAPRGDVLIGLDAPDDAAVVDTGGERLSVHTVDYFRAMIDDPYRFGMIAANHALGDLFAMGAEAQTALAIATIPYGIEAKVETTLSDMMQGANEILRDSGCALVGGHSSEGAELALGFALNGLVARHRVLRKLGMRPGDALLLTKPLGTGTLLAADMRGRAKARWIEAAITHMLRSNRVAADALLQHDVHAMTDVTGFGLLGHLVEMTRASGVAATLWLDRIPLLDGARETAARGILSSLQPENTRLRRAIRDLPAVQQFELYPLLFDPQTAGGLLAGVPGDRAQSCCDALHAAGYDSARIVGCVSASDGAPESITVLEHTPPEFMSTQERSTTPS